MDEKERPENPELSSIADQTQDNDSPATTAPQRASTTSHTATISPTPDHKTSETAATHTTPTQPTPRPRHFREREQFYLWTWLARWGRTHPLNIAVVVIVVVVVIWFITRLVGSSNPAPTGTGPLAQPTPTAGAGIVVPPPVQQSALSTLPVAGAITLTPLVQDPGIIGPTDIMIDSAGHIIVASPGSKSVVIVNGTSQKVIQTIKKGAKSFAEPAAVATDAQGQLYVLDATNNSIDVLSKTGAPIKVIGSSAGFYHPRGIAVSPAGDIYVGDPGRNRIVRFSSDGTMISSLNTPIGSNPDQLNQPTSVAVDKQGHVYVVDTLNNRVDEFSPSTGATWSLLNQWAIEATDTLHAAHIFIAGNSLVITDPTASRLIVYPINNSSPPQAHIVPLRTASGTINPVGITISKGGTLLITDAVHNSVWRGHWTK